jgi:iron-sulfur cluster repair protein YtfE (RIC family)
MKSLATATATEADVAHLDAYHRQVRPHLDRLAALAARVENAPLADPDCAEACAIEAFFSGSMREHHLMEEAIVFPTLLASGDGELVTLVRTLMQDHGWIEQTWLEIAPQLRAVAQGHHWIDPAEFSHGAEVFLELCYGHAALEDTVIHPQALARLAEAPATQVAGAAS